MHRFSNVGKQPDFSFLHPGVNFIFRAYETNYQPDRISDLNYFLFINGPKKIRSQLGID